jgi:outer membrane protein insertion porin family
MNLPFTNNIQARCLGGLSRILTLLFLILLYTCSNAQETQKTYKILGINVVGNQTADASTIIANSGLQIGDEVQIPGDQTMTAIRNLWNLGIFSDVQIVMDKQVGDGVFLTIKVKEYPRIEKTVIVGNDELSTSKIEDQISFGRGQILRPQDVKSLIEKILKLYEDDGYLNAKIDPEYFEYFRADTTENGITVTWRNKKDLSDEYKTNYDKSEIEYSDLITKIKDRILLKLNIDEGERVVVRKIEFEGNKAFTDDDLKDQMDNISEAVWWKFWNGAKFDPEKLKKDEELITKFYRKNGYIDADVTSDSLIYSNDKKDLTILIKVYEGKQYYVRNIKWEGNTLFPDAFLAQRLGLKKGDVFNYEKFQENLKGNKDQTDISSLYMNSGYLTFNAEDTEKKVGTDSIDIDVRLDERNRFKVDKIKITGNDKTEDKVIRRELYTVPGDYFNRSLLIRSIQQLANLKYFDEQKLYGPDAINYNLATDSTVDLTYKVDEKSSDYLNASVGYSGSFGFSGSIGITLSNFALSHPFTLGGGQILSFDWEFGVGSIYRTFTLGFTEPWFLDTPTLLGFQVFDTRQQYYYDLSQTGATVRVGRRLKWPDDFFDVQGYFRYQYNDVLNGEGFYAEGKYNQFTLGATISRKNIDNPIFPSKGSNFSLNGELSGGPFLPGDLNYYKLNYTMEWYKSLFNTNRIVLYTIANLGYLHELDEATKTRINPFDKFFMGGNGLVIATEPLRGYDDRSIGPKDASGNVLGGRVMERFTTELRFSVTQDPVPLYLLAFAEAGNVFPNLKNTDFLDLRRSVGVGARVLINPIGLIGFDLGYGFDRKEVDGNNPGWLFHFQFGKGF